MGKKRSDRFLISLAICIAMIFVFVANISAPTLAASAKENASKIKDIVVEEEGTFFETDDGMVFLSYYEDTDCIEFEFVDDNTNAVVKFMYSVAKANNSTQLEYECDEYTVKSTDFDSSKYTSDTKLSFGKKYKSDETEINKIVAKAFANWELYLKTIDYSLKDLGFTKYSAAEKTCDNHNDLEVTITPATTKQDGFEGKVCPECGYTKGKTIAQIDCIVLDDTEYIATGKAIKPGVTVVDVDGDEISAKNYTVTYSNNIKAGTATVTVKFTGKRYSGKLTAKFTIKAASSSYKVAFDGNGASSGKMSTITCKLDKATKLTANAFTRKGYTFTGWNTKADGSGKTYKDQATVKNLSSKANKTVTLYAQWKANTYTIKFVGNGSTSGSSSSIKCTYGKSYKLTANSFKKKGYTFTGWNTKKDGSGTSYSNKASIKNLSSKSGGTITLYAQWKAVKYKITYKLDGGTNNSSNPSTYTTAKGATLKNPTKSGYTFAGWYTDSSFKNKVTSIAKGKTGDITLYAKWTKKSTTTTTTYTSDPDFSAYIVNKSYKTYFIDVDIKNYGSKTLTVKDIALFYPNGGSYYCDAELLGNNYESISGMRVGPGVSGTLHFTVDTSWYITSYSEIVFVFEYDGVDYMCVAYRDKAGYYKKMD